MTIDEAPRLSQPTRASECGCSEEVPLSTGAASVSLPLDCAPAGQDRPNVSPATAQMRPHDRRERSDTYSGEIVRSGDWRVVVCREGIQWLIQRRRKPRQEGATPAWTSKGHCRTRAALVRLWRAHTGEDGATLLALLPEHFHLLKKDHSPSHPPSLAGFSG